VPAIQSIFSLTNSNSYK